jgi:hypothetical protein
MPCNLNYIPSHLHWNGREILREFQEDEKLYLRIHPEHSTPFKSITLADLSLNRDGGRSKLCNPEDVLWNLNEEDIEERYDQGIKYFSISYQGSKEYREDPSILLNKDDDNLKIKLSHNPLDCNYPHCDLNFLINDSIEVTKENWKHTLGSNEFKKIRKEARLKLHSAIIQKELVMLD